MEEPLSSTTQRGFSRSSLQVERQHMWSLPSLVSCGSVLVVDISSILVHFFYILVYNLLHRVSTKLQFILLSLSSWQDREHGSGRADSDPCITPFCPPISSQPSITGPRRRQWWSFTEDCVTRPRGNHHQHSGHFSIHLPHPTWSGCCGQHRSPKVPDSGYTHHEDHCAAHWPTRLQCPWAVSTWFSSLLFHISYLVSWSNYFFYINDGDDITSSFNALCSQ